MEIVIGKKKFKIRALSPADWLSEEGGSPISFFTVDSEKDQTMFEKTMGLSKKEEQEQAKSGANQVRALKSVLPKCVISMDGEPFDCEKYLTDEAEDIGGALLEAATLFQAIINISFKKFFKPIKVEKSAMDIIDAISKRYGSPPIDVLFPNGGYSDMDAYTFNLFIAAYSIRDENEQNKRIIARQRRAAKRGKR